MLPNLLFVLGLALAQFAPAFLAVDLMFRHMDVEPTGLALRLRSWTRRYVAGALGFSLAAGWLQWRLAGAPGAAAVLLNGVPWWLLWRFGLRKQLTFLFKDDGGRAAAWKNPDR
jgi:hypothetical protein